METLTPKRKKKRPSRRWPTAKDFKIRSAVDTDGPVIAALLALAGPDFRHLDWHSIGAGWIVADREGEIVGALQICNGKPIGRLELLAIDPKRSKTFKAKLVKGLVLTGCKVLAVFGAQEVQVLTPADQLGYHEIIERYGGRKQSEGILFSRPLTELAERYRVLAEELNA